MLPTDQREGELLLGLKGQEEIEMHVSFIQTDLATAKTVIVLPLCHPFSRVVSGERSEPKSHAGGS
jgi:hypothetical protein